MNCLQVQRDLTLWVGADLPAQAAAELERHLGQCPHCRVAAEALSASQTFWMEGTSLPFTAADHAELRREVMVRIRQEGGRPSKVFRGRPLLLGLAAGLLCLAVPALLRRHGPTTPALLAAPPRVAGLAASQIVQPIPVLQASPKGKRPARPQPTLEQVSPAGGEPASIEFKTDNPQIRIIWLARAQPASPADPTQP